MLCEWRWGFLCFCSAVTAREKLYGPNWLNGLMKLPQLLNATVLARTCWSRGPYTLQHVFVFFHFYQACSLYFSVEIWELSAPVAHIGDQIDVTIRIIFSIRGEMTFFRNFLRGTQATKCLHPVPGSSSPIHPIFSFNSCWKSNYQITTIYLIDFYRSKPLVRMKDMKRRKVLQQKYYACEV